MKAVELKQKYLAFFKSKQHAIIPSASLVPENDPTVLFTTAGMHPLVPFLMGQPHPLGKRLTDVQKCVRTGDIDDVGDATHLTFFEMLGNWSLGDYFKKESISWSFEFLTSKEWLHIPLNRLAFTCFEGNQDAPKDTESQQIWLGLGVPSERIAFLPKEDNWWGPAGQTGPCGPDTEIFYWKDNSTPAPKVFDPKDKRWVEIWNNVFMQYDKKKSTLLVDGMNCLYDENFKINDAVLTAVKEHTGSVIVVVNGYREKAEALVTPLGFSVFSMDGAVKKDSKDFFTKLFAKHNIVAGECIYTDHQPAHVAVAQALGVRSQLFTKDTQSLQNFIAANQYGFALLTKQCVDTGMGVERTTFVLQGKENVYDTEVFQPTFAKVAELSGKQPDANHIASFRIIADHIRTATFMLGDERSVTPSNTDRGYILRRLIRRLVRHASKLGITTSSFCATVAQLIIHQYRDEYPMLKEKKQFIVDEFNKEEEKFKSTIDKGLSAIKKKIVGEVIKAKGIDFLKSTGLMGKDNEIVVKLSEFGVTSVTIEPQWVFDQFQSHGMPTELTVEEIKGFNLTIANEAQIKLDVAKLFIEHQEKSRAGAEQKFKGGLADNSERTVRLHTATHLLNEALRKVVDPKIVQKGSNITAERARFDFNFDRKLTPEEVKAVEAEVNRVVQLALPVTIVEMSPEDAKTQGAQSEFGQRYPSTVTVYKMGDYSMEICMGPHVKNTKEVGVFTIQKEESSAAGIRRIKATVE